MEGEREGGWGGVGWVGGQRGDGMHIMSPKDTLDYLVLTERSRRGRVRRPGWPAAPTAGCCCHSCSRVAAVVARFGRLGHPPAFALFVFG